MWCVDIRSHSPCIDHSVTSIVLYVVWREDAEDDEWATRALVCMARRPHRRREIHFSKHRRHWNLNVLPTLDQLSPPFHRRQSFISRLKWRTVIVNSQPPHPHLIITMMRVLVLVAMMALRENCRPRGRWSLRHCEMAPNYAVFSRSCPTASTALAISSQGQFSRLSLLL